MASAPYSRFGELDHADPGYAHGRRKLTGKTASTDLAEPEANRGQDTGQRRTGGMDSYGHTALIRATAFRLAEECALFCQHCGKPIGEGSVFCNHCGGRQGVVASEAPVAGVRTFMDEVLTDRDEIVQDPRYGAFPPGQVIHIHAKVESGGPYEMWVIGADGEEVLKVFEGIAVENTFDFRVPKDGKLGFDFQSVGAPGTVRLQVF